MQYIALITPIKPNLNEKDIKWFSLINYFSTDATDFCLAEIFRYHHYDISHH